MAIQLLTKSQFYEAILNNYETHLKYIELEIKEAKSKDIELETFIDEFLKRVDSIKEHDKKMEYFDKMRQKAKEDYEIAKDSGEDIDLTYNSYNAIIYYHTMYLKDYISKNKLK